MRLSASESVVGWLSEQQDIFCSHEVLRVLLLLSSCLATEVVVLTNNGELRYDVTGRGSWSGG
jgi:hypothetical protein